MNMGKPYQLRTYFIMKDKAVLGGSQIPENKFQPQLKTIMMEDLYLQLENLLISIV